MWDWKNAPPSVPGDPKKFIKLVVSVSLGLLVLWVFVMAQTERSGQEPVAAEEQYRLDSLRQALGTEGQQPTQQTSEGRGMFFNAFTTFLVLVGLIGVLWWWFSRKSESAGLSSVNTGSGTVANVVATQQIGVGQEIKIIEINDEYWVLGTSGQSVNLLHRYKKSEWNRPEDFTPPAANKSESDSSFSRILSSLQQKK